MTSGYRPDDDEYVLGRAKRSRAGALQPSFRGRRESTSFKATPPQAIVKVNGWATTPASVKRMLDYISRVDDKEDRELVALEAEDGVARKGQAEVDEILNEWKPDFERKSKERAGQSRHAVHLVFSAKAELTSKNVERTLAAARRVVEKHFGEAGYPYALGVHQDGKHPHVHAVIKTTSQEKGAPKLRLGPARLFEIRQSLARELTREGLEHVATRQPKREKARHSNIMAAEPDTLKKIEAVLLRLEKEQRQFQRALGRKEPRVNAFKFREQQGKALGTLWNQAKNDPALVDKDRLKAFNLIRGFRRKIEKKGIDPYLEVMATASHLESRIAKWQKELGKDLASALDKKDGPSARTIEMGQSLHRDLKDFKCDLRKQDIPVETKKEIGSRFWDHSKAVEKISEKWLGRER